MSSALLAISSKALLVAAALLTMTACSQAQWQQIQVATLSPDERTLTVEVSFGTPETRPRECERVTDTEVRESPSQVIIGVQVHNTCSSPWPWEGDTLSIAYVRRVSLQLRQPLAERTVLNNTGHDPVAINRS